MGKGNPDPEPVVFVPGSRCQVPGESGARTRHLRIFVSLGISGEGAQELGIPSQNGLVEF